MCAGGRREVRGQVGVGGNGARRKDCIEVNTKSPEGL